MEEQRFLAKLADETAGGLWPGKGSRGQNAGLIREALVKAMEMKREQIVEILDGAKLQMMGAGPESIRLRKVLNAVQEEIREG